MRIAVCYDDGEVFQHFGRTEYFKIYDVEGGKVVSSRIVGNGGLAHGGLVQILLDNGVDTFICGGIGAGARQMVQSRGINILPGAQGNCDACVEAFLKGSLQYDPETECHHHDGGEHSCNCHRSFRGSDRQASEIRGGASDGTRDEDQEHRFPLTFITSSSVSPRYPVQ